MALRGETIGTAYVRILASGSDLGKSIRKEFEGQAETFEAAGQKNAERYNKGYDDVNDKARKERIKDLVHDTQEMAGRMNAAGEKIEQGLFNPLRDQLKHRFGEEIGNRLAKQIEEGFVRSGGRDLGDSLIGNLPAEVQRSVQKIQRAEERFRADREAAYAEHGRRVDAEWKKMLDTAYRMNADFNRRVKRNNDQANADRRAQLAEAFQMNRDFDNKTRALQADRDREFEIHARMLARAARDAEDKQRRSGNETRRWARAIDVFSNSVGKAFGKGARNNFVNLIGVVVGGIAWLGGEAAKLMVGFVSHIAGVFRSASSVGAAFGQLAAEGIGAVAFALGAVAIAAPVAGAALAALSFIIGPLVALISGLAGIIAALAATLTFGLIAAVAAVATALVPLAAGIGILVLGFKNLSKEQKAAFKPVGAVFKQWGKIADNEIFRKVGDHMSGLTKIMQSFNPVVRKVSTQIGRQANLWIDAVKKGGKNGPFGQFRQAMEDFLPDATKHIGDIGRQSFGILGGLIRASIPLARRFLTWLDKITGRFSEWINSAKGQRSVKKFLDDAADSANSVWKFLGKVWDVLWKILNAGQGTGNNIFDSMTKGLTNFDKFISPDPTPKGTADLQRQFKGAANTRRSPMEDFFKNAGQTADDIGMLVKHLSAMFDELDNEQNRKSLHEVADGIDLIATAIGKLNDGGGFGAFRDLASATSALQVIGALALKLDGMSKKDWSHLWDNIWDGLTFHGDVSAIFDWIGPAFQHGMDMLIGHLKIIPWNKLLKIDWKGIGQGIWDFLTFKGDLKSIHWSKLVKIDWKGIANGIWSALTFHGDIVHINWKSLLNIPKSLGIDIKIPKITWPKLPGWITNGINLKFHLPKISWPKVPGWLSNVLIAWKIPHPPKWPQIPGWLKTVLIGFSIPHQPRWPQIPGWLKDVLIHFSVQDIDWPGIPDWLAHPSIDIFPTIHWPSAPSWLSRVTASGGIFSGAQSRIIGEAGPEAVVPLNRPLRLVDPAVRELSAIAQGLKPLASGGVVGTQGKVVNVGGLTVITPTKDPVAVASETVNRLVAVGY